MKKLLIIAHNVNSAGITSQTINLINELKSRDDLKYTVVLPDHAGFSLFKNVKSDNLKIILLPYPKNKIIRLLSRLFYELICIPLITIKTNPESVLALANYLPMPIFFRKKAILIRHPYLLKKDLSDDSPLGKRLNEKLTRFLLKLTLLTTDLVIVQSDYMKDGFQKAFKNKVQLLVLPNPLSNAFKTKHEIEKKGSLKSENDTINLFYPSRFYPHKNHTFINELVKKYHEELEILKVRIIVTLGKESVNYSFRYEKDLYEKLIAEIDISPYNKVIVNIGELNQEELIQYYNNSTALFFPSSEETFGNGLIEGMFFRLPILVPDLSYARIICDNAGIYFKPDDLDSVFQLIKIIATDKEFVNEQSLLSEQRFANFILTDEWVDTLIAKINSLYHKQ